MRGKEKVRIGVEETLISDPFDVFGAGAQDVPVSPRASSDEAAAGKAYKAKCAVLGASAHIGIECQANSIFPVWIVRKDNVFDFRRLRLACHLVSDLASNPNTAFQFKIDDDFI